MAKNEKEITQPSLPNVKDRIEGSLLDARRLFISDAIDSESASDVIEKIWYLELSNPGKPILLIINSPGGSVDAGFAIWDQIKMITSPVSTLVTGIAASMGSVLSLVAPKGKRFATPYARFMIHQPRVSDTIRGQATDLEIQTKEMLKIHNTLVDIYVEETGQNRQVIEKAIDRDTWMSADEAKSFGLINGVVNTFQELQKKVGA
jgi:ATP-dependent Clp protease protease subunit